MRRTGWEQLKRASLDDTLCVLTPQGRVVDLPRSATPVDFATTACTDVGPPPPRRQGRQPPHTPEHPAGERADGGIVTAKEGGPSRDWLDTRQGYVATLACVQQDQAVLRTTGRRRSSRAGAASSPRRCSATATARANIDGLAERPASERRGAVPGRRAWRRWARARCRPRCARAAP